MAKKFDLRSFGVRDNGEIGRELAINSIDGGFRVREGRLLEVRLYAFPLLYIVLIWI